MKREGPDDQRGKRLPRASLWMAAVLTAVLVALPLLVNNFERAHAERRITEALERLGAIAAGEPAPAPTAGKEDTDAVFVLAALAAVDEPWDYQTLDGPHSFPALVIELRSDGRDVAATLLDSLGPCASQFGGASLMWESFWNPAYERAPVALPSRAQCERQLLETQLALCEEWTAAAEDICRYTWFDPEWLQPTPSTYDGGAFSSGSLVSATGIGGLGYVSTHVVGGFTSGPTATWPPLRGSEGAQGRGIQGAAVGFGARARIAALDGDAASAALDLERAFCLSSLFADHAHEDAGRYWELLMSMSLNDIESVLHGLPPGTEFEELTARLGTVNVRGQLRLRWRGMRSGVLERVQTARAEDGDFEPGKAATLLEWAEGVERKLELPSWELLGAFEASELSAYELASSEDEFIRLEADLEHTATELLRLEAMLLLARTALVGHAHGKEAAATFAASLVDPFDGLPLRTRTQADGSLLLWSVGQDGFDDGGTVAGSAGHGDDHCWVIR